MIDPSYKNDLLPANERRLPCAWCGAPHVLMHDGYYRCARHERTRGTPPIGIDQSPVTPPTPNDLAAAIGAIVTSNGALEIARKARRR